MRLLVSKVINQFWKILFSFQIIRKKADAYYGAGFHIWDIVAAEIILTEAGGVNTSLKDEISIFCESFDF